MTLQIRRIVTVRDETRSEGGLDADRPLVKAAAIAVLKNPYAGQPYSADLARITDDNYELGKLLASTPAATLGLEVDGYEKASLVGTNGQNVAVLKP